MGSKVVLVVSFLTAVGAFVGSHALAEWECTVPSVNDKNDLVFAAPGDCIGDAWFTQKSRDEQMGRTSVQVGADNYGADAHGPSTCDCPGNAAIMENSEVFWSWTGDDAHECESKDGDWKLSFLITINFNGEGSLALNRATFNGTYEVKCSGPKLTVTSESDVVSTLDQGKSIGKTEGLSQGSPTFTVQQTVPPASWDVEIRHRSGEAPPTFDASFHFWAASDWAGSKQACQGNDHSMHVVDAELTGDYDCYLGVPTFKPH